MVAEEVSWGDGKHQLTKHLDAASGRRVSTLSWKATAPRRSTLPGTRYVRGRGRPRGREHLNAGTLSAPSERMNSSTPKATST